MRIIGLSISKTSKHLMILWGLQLLTKKMCLHDVSFCVTYNTDVVSLYINVFYGSCFIDVALSFFFNVLLLIDFFYS